MGGLCGSDIAEAANSLCCWVAVARGGVHDPASDVASVCGTGLSDVAVRLREHTAASQVFRVLSEQVGRWAFGLGIDALRLDQLNGVVPNRTRQAVVALDVCPDHCHRRGRFFCRTRLWTTTASAKC